MLIFMIFTDRLLQNLQNVYPYHEVRDDKLGDIHIYLQGTFFLNKTGPSKRLLFLSSSKFYRKHCTVVGLRRKWKKLYLAETPNIYTM